MRPKQHADLDPSHARTNETKGLDRRQALKSLVAAGGLGLGIPGLAHAQFRVDVAGIGLTQRPFAIAPFRGRASHPTAFDDVVSADLERSGLFRAVPVTSDPLDESSLPDLAPWRARGIDALITGSVNRAANGRVDVRYRLWDVVAGEDL
ncbi:MAG: hypothetical protein ACO2ZW_03545, partial [Burkholderiaceae bacterium]